jgi:CheY-like chemotaxis protein
MTQPERELEPNPLPDEHLVLIVEDEVLVRMLVSDILQDAGFKVIEAKNATEALRVLEARPDVQVLFTDAEMPPGPTGYELAHQVCKRWRYIEIIVSSGRACLKPGEAPACVVFLPKPWTDSSVAKHVQDAIDRAATRR